MRRRARGLREGIGVAQALALGAQGDVLAGRRCDGADALHEVAEVGEHAVPVGGLVLGGAPRVPGVAQRAPGGRHRAEAGGLLLAGVGIEQLALHGRTPEPARLVLRDHADEALARRLERRPRGRAPADERLPAAVRPEPAGEDEAVLVFRHEVADAVVRRLLDVRGQVELRLDVRLRGMRADEPRVARGAEHEPERAREHGLAGAGLARQHRQPGAEPEVGRADQDEVLDGESAQHGRISGRTCCGNAAGTAVAEAREARALGRHPDLDGRPLVELADRVPVDDDLGREADGARDDADRVAAGEHERARVERVRGDERRDHRVDAPAEHVGPPAERLYAVEPLGVATTTPSQPRSPNAMPLTAQSSSAMRPWIEDETRTSLIATWRSPCRRASTHGSSMIS